MLLDVSSSALKKRSVQHKGKGDSLRGHLEIRSNGVIQFRSSQDAPQFLSELATWAVPLFEEYAGIRRLRGARLTCKDKKGNVLGKYKNDDVWS